MTEDLFARRKEATAQLAAAMDELDKHRGQIYNTNRSFYCTTFESAFSAPFGVTVSDESGSEAERERKRENSLKGQRLEQGLGVLRRLNDAHPPQVAQIREALTNIRTAWTQDVLHGVASNYPRFSGEMNAAADTFIAAIDAYMDIPFQAVSFRQTYSPTTSYTSGVTGNGAGGSGGVGRK